MSDGWTAIVALKHADARKSRLAPRLDPAQRRALAARMAAHVVACLRASPGIAEVRLLSPEPPAMPGVCWARDPGDGLNAGIARVRALAGRGPVLVIHPDLPLLDPADIAAMLAAGARHGAAIAPDRHRDGTNAIAIADGRPLVFAFGVASLAVHRAALGSSCALVERPGLALDIDTPADLDAAIAAGFGHRSPSRTAQKDR